MRVGCGAITTTLGVAPQTFSRVLRRLPDINVMDESKRQKLMPEEQEAQQKHMGAAKIYFAATTIPGASCSRSPRPRAAV